MELFNTNGFLMLFSILVFGGFVATVWIKHGIQKSVSAIYYSVEAGAWFTVVLWVSVIPIMIVAHSLLAFLAGVGVCFVGASPDYRKKIEGKVHINSVYTMLLFSTASIIVDFKLWYLAVAFGVISAIVKLLRIKNNDWWVEIALYLLFWFVVLFNRVI